MRKQETGKFFGAAFSKFSSFTVYLRMHVRQREERERERERE